MKKKIILLSISFLLLGFSIFSFFFFTSSLNVSIEYRMFYIDHELNYYLEDNGFKNHYSVGTTCLYKTGGNYRNQGKGWGGINSISTSTKAKPSNIYFYINEEQQDFTFNIEIENTLTTKISVSVNDTKTECSFDLSKGTKHSCILSNSLFKKNNVNKISINNSSDQYFNVTMVSLL